MNIGELMKKIRLIYGFTAVYVSQMLNISASYLSEIEHNKRTPSIELLQAFADLCDLKLSMLILIAEEYSHMRKNDTAERIIQKKMISLVNKYSKDLNDEEDLIGDQV